MPINAFLKNSIYNKRKFLVIVSFLTLGSKDRDLPNLANSFEIIIMNLMNKIAFLIIVLTLSSCSNVASPIDEKERFINSTIDVSCLLIGSENLEADLSSEKRVETDEKVRDIFKNHGFAVDDNELFAEISLKYENDQEVIAAVHKGVQKCNK